MFSRSNIHRTHEHRCWLINPLSITRRPEDGRRRPRAFTVIELLVVVGIIALLVGILLVALGSARQAALKGETRSLLNQFAAAAQQFQLEHSRYPGVIPDRILTADPQISNMENALLDLMGGYRLYVSPDDDGTDRQTEYDAFVASLPPGSNGVSWLEYDFADGGRTWNLAVSTDRMGEGPVIDGKAYPPYFTPDEGVLRTVAGQLNEGGLALPDLVDSWGMPIVYLRQSRSTGPLFVAGEAADPYTPQFMRAGAVNYIGSAGLGERQVDQTDGDQGSILNLDLVLGWQNAVGHGAIAGQARGGFLVLSAGPDGFYLSRVDGPGNQGAPTTAGDLAPANFQPTDVDEYDDIRVFGGG